jgi:serine/threonine protein kinase
MGSGLEEYIEEQYGWLKRQNLFTAPLPVLKSSQISRGKLIAHTNKAEIFEATIDAHSMHSPSGFVVKDYTGFDQYLRSVEPENRVAARQLFARGITLAAQSTFQGSDDLVLPRALVFGDQISLVFERWDTDLLQYVQQLRRECLDQKMLGEKIFQLLRQSAQVLSSFHKAGNMHYDIKPSNFFIRDKAENILVGLSDFDLVGYQPGMFASSSNATKALNDVTFGTPRYMPKALQQGEYSRASAPRRFFDKYAFGVSIGELAFDLDFESPVDAGPLTRMLKHEDHRKSDTWRAIAQARGYEDLGYLWLYLTDEGPKRGTDDFGEVVEMLDLIAHGQGSKVRKDRNVKKALIYRDGEEAGNRTVLRRRVKIGAAAAAVAGVLATGGLIWRRDAQAMRYAQSLEGLARTAAKEKLRPSTIVAFTAAAVEQFKRRDMPAYLKQRKDDPHLIFPFFTHMDMGTRYQHGKSSLSAYFLDELVTLAVMTKDPDIFKWTGDWADGLEMDWEAEQSEKVMPMVGRFAPVLHLKNIVSKQSYNLALHAAAIALHQYDARSQSFQGIRESGPIVSISLRQQHFLQPMMHSILQSPDLDSILDARQLEPLRKSTTSQQAGDDQLAQISNYVRQLRPLRKKDVLDMTANSAIAACRALVAPDGKSYWAAEVKDGAVLRRGMRGAREPDYRLPPEQQPVLTQDLTSLYLAVGYAWNALHANAIVHPSSRELSDCMRRLASYYRRHKGVRALPQEYLFLPSSVEKVQNRDRELLGPMQYIYGSALFGDDTSVRNTLSEVFATQPFNANTKYPGLLNGVRMTVADWYGYCPYADSLLFKTLQYLKKK